MSLWEELFDATFECNEGPLYSGYCQPHSGVILWYGMFFDFCIVFHGSWFFALLLVWLDLFTFLYFLLFFTLLYFLLDCRKKGLFWPPEVHQNPFLPVLIPTANYSCEAEVRSPLFLIRKSQRFIILQSGHLAGTQHFLKWDCAHYLISMLGTYLFREPWSATDSMLRN